MLIVVEHGNVQCFDEPLLDLEAPGRRNILQIDTAEARCYQLHRPHDLLRVLGVQADGVGIYAAEALKETRLPLHHRQGRLRADIPQTQHRRSVGNDGHSISLARISVYLLPILCDLQARLRYPRRIRQRQIMLGLDVHLQRHRQLPLMHLVQLQGLLFQRTHTFSSLCRDGRVRPLQNGAVSMILYSNFHATSLSLPSA